MKYRMNNILEDADEVERRLFNEKFNKDKGDKE